MFWERFGGFNSNLELEIDILSLGNLQRKIPVFLFKKFRAKDA